MSGKSFSKTYLFIADQEQNDYKNCDSNRNPNYHPAYPDHLIEVVLSLLYSNENNGSFTIQNLAFRSCFITADISKPHARKLNILFTCFNHVVSDTHGSYNERGCKDSCENASNLEQAKDTDRLIISVTSNRFTLYDPCITI